MEAKDARVVDEAEACGCGRRGRGGGGGGVVVDTRRPTGIPRAESGAFGVGVVAPRVGVEAFELGGISFGSLEYAPEYSLSSSPSSSPPSSSSSPSGEGRLGNAIYFL